MLKAIILIQLLSFVFFSILGCSNVEKNSEMIDSSSSETKEGILRPDTIKNISNTENPAYEYNKVIKAQKILLQEFSWPGKHELDLNDDKINEEFLAIEAYSRGMGYALFTRQNQNWILISGDENIASGHLGILKLDKSNDGWHDFVAIQPSGRDGIIESFYTWNGKKYILKDHKEKEN